MTVTVFLYNLPDETKLLSVKSYSLLINSCSLYVPCLACLIEVPSWDIHLKRSSIIIVVFPIAFGPSSL